MTGFRSPLMPERIVAEIPIGGRHCLVLEEILGAVLVWRCPRTPAGRTVLGSCDRVMKIPKAALQDFTAALLDLDEPSSSVGRRANG